MATEEEEIKEVVVEEAAVAITPQEEVGKNKTAPKVTFRFGDLPEEYSVRGWVGLGFKPPSTVIPTGYHTDQVEIFFKEEMAAELAPYVNQQAGGIKPCFNAVLGIYGAGAKKVAEVNFLVEIERMSFYVGESNPEAEQGCIGLMFKIMSVPTLVPCKSS